MDRDLVTAQTPKSVIVTRMYTGPDNLTHIEEVPAAFSSTNVAQLMKITGAEIHRAAPGNVNNWHTAPRRQYVITLSGRGEIEASDGKKFVSEPGHIELAEDTTGKGHITRVLGSEERVTLWLPLVDQPAKSPTGR
jgi:hypothetical protein